MKCTYYYLRNNVLITSNFSDFMVFQQKSDLLLLRSLPDSKSQNFNIERQISQRFNYHSQNTIAVKWSLTFLSFRPIILLTCQMRHSLSVSHWEKSTPR